MADESPREDTLPSGVPGRVEGERAAEADAECIRLSEADRAVFERLVEAGQHGVGGACRTESPLELALPKGVRTSADLRAGERLDPARALGALHVWLGALAWCEAHAVRLGQLGPRDLVIEPRPFVRADEWMALALGRSLDAASQRGTGLSAWGPPEHADGALWDAAANRYVVVLVAYRLIDGHHPFSGLGWRHAAQARAERGPPPLEDDDARRLPAGVHAWILASLSPDPRDRPSSAKAMHEALGELLRGRALAHLRSRRRVRTAPAKLERPKTHARGLYALIGGLAMTFVAVDAFVDRGAGGDGAAQPERRVRVPARTSLSARSEACRSCHSTEAAEWNGSVMAHASTSPLFGALESLIEEQVARSDDCPDGAGALRRAGAGACVDARGERVTGSGGEHWCVNCHVAGENVRAEVPTWEAFGDPRTRAPLVDLMSDEAKNGISCVVCHATVGPVGPHGLGGGYEGNPTWRSVGTGAIFRFRPEDARGVSGISNSGYALDVLAFLSADPTSARAHAHATSDARSYTKSSEFCGSCHDVRLFGTDAIRGPANGEHFKRLRNAYSEWREWRALELAAGREAASCQGCHMSTFPGVCVPGSDARDARSASCPSGYHFEARDPARDSASARGVHYFTSVDLPLGPRFDVGRADTAGIDARGLPLGLRARRDLLLRSSVSLELGTGRILGDAIEVPVRIENIGAGHRVPAGFSQEREIWLELSIVDADDREIYRVGHVERSSEDLADKRFARVTTRPTRFDRQGRPLGLFGADVVDGPDAPKWSPDPRDGGRQFVGQGLVNFQNGFLRCVRCIGIIDERGVCQPGSGQGRTRADRFADGFYDIDTGECVSNLTGERRFFETYFPVGSLDADRGIIKAPDAIIDTRSLPPKGPVEYVFRVDRRGARLPLSVRATLHFRAFPPYLLKAFIEYEAEMQRLGKRPSGPLISEAVLDRLDIVDLAEQKATIR